MRTPAAVADELMAAYAARRTDVQPPSTAEASFDLSAGYAVEAEVVRRRRASGRTTVGLKVAFANSAMWRVLNVDTVAWAHMYDDTVRYAEHGRASLSLSRMASPKIEPEIVLALKSPVPPGTTDAAAALEHVEWIALGFEIIDCVYANWTFQPADFVASLWTARRARRRRTAQSDRRPHSRARGRLGRVHGLTRTRRPGGGRGRRQERLAQPGPVPRGTGVGDRAARPRHTTRRRRPHLLGHAHPIAADCAGRTMDSSRGRPRIGEPDADALGLTARL